VSSIESKSSHPLAEAVVDHGRSLSIEPKPENVTEFENFPGEGICGKINERVIYIGNKKIATRAGSETGEKALSYCDIACLSPIELEV
jgi:Zn2+/Cd2+-exporting ATPase